MGSAGWKKGGGREIEVGVGVGVGGLGREKGLGRASCGWVGWGPGS